MANYYFDQINPVAAATPGSRAYYTDKASVLTVSGGEGCHSLMVCEIQGVGQPTLAVLSHKNIVPKGKEEISLVCAYKAPHRVTCEIISSFPEIAHAGSTDKVHRAFDGATLLGLLKEHELQEKFVAEVQAIMQEFEPKEPTLVEIFEGITER